MREQILTFLEKNSRIDPKELAVLLGSDEVTIMNEIAKMEEEKVICGYHTLIDWEKVSDEKVTALIEVRVTPMRGQGFDSIAERIYNFEQVLYLFFRQGRCWLVEHDNFRIKGNCFCNFCHLTL